MTGQKSGRAHLIAGGFPPGSAAGHDHDYARLRLLGLLAERDVPASVANDFSDIEKWLPVSQLLITYVAGPYPDTAQRRGRRSAGNVRHSALTFCDRRASGLSLIHILTVCADVFFAHLRLFETQCKAGKVKDRLTCN